jgi:hypothetical protein
MSPLPDLSPLYLLLISSGTILYSCGTSSRVIFRISDDIRPAVLRTDPDQLTEITFPRFLSMVITASTMLLTLFYFVNSVIIFLKCLITFSVISCVAFTIWDWFCLLLPSRPSTYFTIATALITSLTWFVTEHWLITDFIAFCLSCATISFIKVHRLHLVLLISVGFLIYDVYWVFLSPAHFGKSVMVETATKVAPHMPVVFSVPREGRSAMIGVGDIVLPGIVLDFFMRFDAFHNSSLFVIAFIGYVAGVTIAWAAVNVTQKGQPALLWIFPAVLVPVLVVAGWQGLMGELWELGAMDPWEENGGDIGTDQDDEQEIAGLLEIGDDGNGTNRRLNAGAGVEG